MPCPTSFRNCLALTLALTAAMASARTLDLRARSLQSGVGKLQGIRLHLDWPSDAKQGRLSVDVASADLSSFGYRFGHLHWECQLATIPQGWSCAGSVSGARGKPMQLAIKIATGSTRIQLSQGASALIVQQIAANPYATIVQLQHVPIDWLRPYVATLWSAARLQKGSVDGRLDIDTQPRAPLRVSGPLTVSGFALDTPDGTIATEGLNATVRIDYAQSTARRSLALQARLQGGEFLYGSLYAKLPTTPVTLEMQAAQVAGGDWNASKLAWNDPGVLDVQGDAHLSSALAVRTANLGITIGNLAVAADRYFSGWLGTAGFAGMTLHGNARADIAIAPAGLQHATVELHDVDARDAKRRFVLSALNGNIAWTADARSVESSVQVAGGAIYGIALGATTLALHSASRELALSKLASLPMLGGKLDIESFNLVPADASHSTHFQLGLRMRDLQLTPMAKAFGWPAFPGTLSGHLPAARFADDVLRFDGGLDAQVFGGKVAVAKLVMERPFGVAPTLSADIDLDNLDLKSLTDVFGFGQITGRLDGSIHDLRLLDWTPVAFDAELHSDASQPDKRRISQRAIKDLSNVGGSGIAGGLQAQALKVFKDFGYAKLGLACRLENNVCHMGGISAAFAPAEATESEPRDATGSGGGYTIVQGSGLPHITVVGFARKVDWPTLVARLKAATEGNGPIVK